MPKKCFLIFIHLKGVCPSRHRKSLGSLLRRIELRSRSYTNLDFRFPPMLTSRCHFCAANHPQPSLDFISRLSIFKQRKGTKICLWDNSEHIKVEETFLFFLRYLAHLFNRAFLILLFFFQHSRWMGKPRKLHSKKCLVTVLTLVWHVTYLTISGRGNILSKLWAWKEQLGPWPKTHSILATFEVQKNQHFSLGSRLV